MILFFSATGNCKHVAERISAAIGDTANSMEEANTKIKLADDEMLGIITPTYWWQLPINVREFLERIDLQMNGKRYVFTLSTYGTTPGASGADASRILRRKGVHVDAQYSVKMPDTWTPIFDLSDYKKVAKQNEAADAEIQGVIADIRSRKSGNMMRRALPYAVRLLTDVLYNNERKTKHLHVGTSCVGCGLCAKNCPMKAIEMQEKRPVWVKKRCAMCLRCLHNCPRFAIQYDDKTQKHGQYVHP